MSRNQFQTFVVPKISLKQINFVKEKLNFLLWTNVEKHLNCSYRALCTWSYSQDYIVPVRREKKPCWLYELKINDSKQFCPRLQGKSKYSVDITSLYLPFPPLQLPSCDQRIKSKICVAYINAKLFQVSEKYSYVLLLTCTHLRNIISSLWLISHHYRKYICEWWKILKTVVYIIFLFLLNPF